MERADLLARRHIKSVFYNNLYKNYKDVVSVTYVQI